MTDLSKIFYYLDGKLYMDRNIHTYLALATVFKIITELSWPNVTEYSADMTGLIASTRKPEDIVKLEFDFLPLHNKFVLWNWEKRESGEPICFDDDELKILRQCCNTAYYYYILHGYNVLSKENKELLVEFFNFLFEKNEIGI